MFLVFSVFALFAPLRFNIALADDVNVARQRFTDGAELVKKAQWAEALAAFEESHRLRPHSITMYNIGACERALGRYTRARAMLAKALALNDTQAGKLPESLVAEALGFIAEIDRLLSHVVVTIEPKDATLTVDGRPVEVSISGPEPPRLIAGTLEPGAGRPPPSGTFELILDPGPHLITLSRKGFTDVLVRENFSPGGRTQRVLKLDLLPGTLNVAANRDGAAVSVDGIDVGVAPVLVSRPAGTYKIQVRKRGFQTHAAEITLRAGEEVKLSAPLAPEKTSIAKKWWFWTAAGVVIAGAAVGTYFGVKASEEPQLDGGGLGWVAKLR